MADEVYGNSERCFVRCVVAFDHQFQAKFIATRFQQRGANQAASVRRHEVDHFRGCVPGGNQKVPLVLTILVIHDNDDFAVADGLDGFRDGVQC